MTAPDCRTLRICEFGSWVDIAEPKMGNEVFIRQLSRDLVRQGHHVDLYLLGDSKTDEHVDGVHLHYVPMPRVLSTFDRLGSTQKVVQKLKVPNMFKLLFGLLPSLGVAAWKHLKQADVALVHYADEIVPLLFARLLGTPAVLVTHALHAVWARQLRSVLPAVSYYARSLYYHMTDFLGYALADVILVTSEREREVALETWKHVPSWKVQVLPNGVDTDTFFPDDELGATTRRQLGIPQEALVVGFTSGMRRDMTNLAAGRYILHSLSSAIWEEFPETYFLIVGDHEPGSLDAPSDPRVLITGFVDQLPPYLNAIDIAIAPYEVGRGAKLKTIEAMSCGRVVIATPQAIGGFEVTSGENAIVCPFSDFPEVLKHVLAHYDTLSAMGCRARELVEDLYSWKSVGCRLGEIFDELRCE